MVNPTQEEVDRYVFSIEKNELDSERQKREVREFWDRHYNRRREFEGRVRLERIRKMQMIVRGMGRTLKVLLAIAVGAFVLWFAAIVRGL